MIGWLRQLARRGRGRPELIQVTLWGKSECSLCDRALAILSRLALEYPLVVEKRDITTNPAAFERYRYVIPVVELAGGPSFELKISEHRLRQALRTLVSGT